MFTFPPEVAMNGSPIICDSSCMCILWIEEESHDYILDGIFRRYTIIDVYIPVWYLITIFTTIILHTHTVIMIPLLL
jgi:hypothetical protein